MGGRRIIDGRLASKRMKEISAVLCLTESSSPSYDAQGLNGQRDQPCIFGRISLLNHVSAPRPSLSARRPTGTEVSADSISPRDGVSAPFSTAATTRCLF